MKVFNLLVNTLILIITLFIILLFIHRSYQFETKIFGINGVLADHPEVASEYIQGHRKDDYMVKQCLKDMIVTLQIDRDIFFVLSIALIVLYAVNILVGVCIRKSCRKLKIPDAKDDLI